MLKKNASIYFKLGLILLSTFLMPGSIYAAGVSVSIPATGTITQGISATVNEAQFGGFLVSSPTVGGTISLNAISCTAVGSGNVQAFGTAACGTLSVTGQDAQQITILFSNSGNFTVGDGSGHSMSGQLNLNGNICYASGGAPLCSSIKIGGVITAQGTNTNPAGAYSTSTGGSPAQLSLTYS
ncbi:MAG: hypothetical protein K0Q57_354 [Gammaproteobacteria bacterium]|jgi:hypothetical protein|nr:hypothetical protein [Gammaproteobacteria bacterium]